MNQELMKIKEDACLAQELCAFRVTIAIENTISQIEDRQLKDLLQRLNNTIHEECDNIKTRISYDMPLSDGFDFAETFRSYEDRTDLSEARKELDDWAEKYLGLIQDRFLWPE